MSVDEAVAARNPPADADAEQALLGAMILRPDLIGETPVTPEDFYRPVHATVAAVLSDMFRLGLAIDVITLGTELTERGETARIGGLPYLHTLISVVPHASHGEHYARIVREKALRRRMREAGIAIEALAYAEAADTDDLVAAAHTRLEILDDAAVGTGPVRAEDLIDAGMLAIEAATQGQVPGIRWPWLDMNGICNPMRGGQLIVIGARPAIGKSTVALDICRETALRNGIPTLMCSLEMDKPEITERLLSAEGRIPLTSLIKGNLTDADWARIPKAIESIGDNPLFIDDSTPLTIGGLRSKMRRLRARHGLGLVAIDYLQLMTSAGKAENRQTEVAALSRGLKLLAKEFGLPIIVMAQLNRALASRSDKRPTLTDLRESGAIEQDADLVLLLHRDDVYDRESPRAGEMDMIVAKQRNGPTGTAVVAMQGHYARTVDMASDTRPWT